MTPELKHFWRSEMSEEVRQGRAFSRDVEFRPTYCECLLLDGRVLQYHLCDENRTETESYLAEYSAFNDWRYLGEGYIYRIDGVRQCQGVDLHALIAAQPPEGVAK